MEELSPLRAQTAKQIDACGSADIDACGTNVASSCMEQGVGQKRPLVLGFDAWHFELSEVPILEETTYG
jgi:hypothetical protein